MKHFIYLNPAIAKKYFNVEKSGRIPVSNNLLWTLFIGMGDQKLALIKDALHGRSPLSVLDSAVCKYMEDNAEDFFVAYRNCCSNSFYLFFDYLGLSNINSLVFNLLYIISYDN